MNRLTSRPDYSWALFLLAAAIFYVVTGSLRGAAIFLLGEIGLRTVMRQLEKRRHQP
jgi:hypothetical protein